MWHIEQVSKIVQEYTRALLQSSKNEFKESILKAVFPPEVNIASTTYYTTIVDSTFVGR